MKNSPNEADLKKLPHLFQVRFAVFCAKQVLHLVFKKNKVVCEAAISAAEGFIDGVTTKEQCLTAANSAYSAHIEVQAAAQAAQATANAAVNAANAAYAAANAAANAATYAAQAAAYAANAAKNATVYAADAAYATAYAANAAHATANAVAYAADAAKNKKALIKEQWDYYNELLNLDLNFEKIVLT